MSADAATAATGVHYLNARWPSAAGGLRAAGAHRQRSRDQVHHLLTGRRHTSLCGRSHECGVLDHLVEEARGGASGALVLRGETGVGKTALLNHAIESASGFTVLRSVGV